MDQQKFGPFLSEMRKKKGLTQTDLAKILSVSTAAVSKWERGLCLPDITKLEDIAGALDISLLEVLKSEQIQEEQIQTAEANTICADTVTEAVHQHRRKLSRIMILVLIVGVMAVLMHFFPIWRVIHVWSPSYYKTGEISMLFYIGDEEDRSLAEKVLIKAEEAFSTLNISSEEAEEQFGLLSRYCNKKREHVEIVSEEHELQLWSSRFYGSEGYMWVYYSQKTFDASGNTVSGSWRIPTLWRLEKNETGMWEVVHIKEHP